MNKENKVPQEEHEFAGWGS